MSNVLSINNLKTYFKTEGGVVKACDGVSYELKKGEVLGVVGESGSGKSVTAMSVMQLIPQPPGYYAGGEIMFEGKDLLKLSQRQMRDIRGQSISMIFQDPMTALNPYLKIGTQLIEVLVRHRTKKMSSDAAFKRCVEMMARTGIPMPDKRMNMYPHELSGGLRQRVMIAMALLNEPSVLIADEPTTALDVTIQAQILDLIKELNHNFGTSVIFISHNLGVVAGMTDRVAVMYAGRVVETASTFELFKNPQHPYTKALLASLPRLDEEKGSSLKPIVGLPPSLEDLPSGCYFHPRCPKKVEKCEHNYPDRKVISDGHWATCWEIK
ncbi:MAG TPA: ABC transporter ATP-binding protein [Oligoflexia bacterium]|nr:ABC transporter ATP-binding protein [Oligoflexia bacterium]HMR24549.1 ABC transporter ATP-binding protein [Oligoflexia bacterium]